MNPFDNRWPPLTLKLFVAIESHTASVVEPLDHREDLMPWCYAQGGYQIENPEPIGEEGIRALARKWLEDRGRAK